jgi:D-inositol-3-phosphate glycosyltransferase
VVCSDIRGYRDLVRDQSDALVVPPRDPEALAGAIGMLLDNPLRRAAMGEAARLTAEKYAWDVVAGEVADVYADVLERAPAPPAPAPVRRRRPWRRRGPEPS